MNQPAFSTATHPGQGYFHRRAAYVLASVCLAAGLLGGCNKSSAPTAQPAETAQAPASQPAAPPADTNPAAPPPAASSAPPAAAPPPASAPASSAASAAPPPAAPAPPPPPKEYHVPAGTSLVVRVGQTVSSKSNSVGDTFTGTLAQSVTAGGVKVFPAGTTVTGSVTAAKGQGRFKGAGDLAVDITRLGSYPVSTTAYEKAQSGKGKRSTALIGGGGGGGALIGGLAGGGKGALIGGLLGAGAGTAGAAFTGNKEITIPAETVVTFKLSAPITVTRKGASE
jgi:hypothetical protein